MDGETCLRQAYDAIFRGDFESAMNGFSQAIALEPDNATYLHSGSITCARNGRLPQALAYARRAAELQPDNPSYQLHLRTLLSKQRIYEARILLAQPAPNIDESAKLLKDATQLDPLSAEARLMLGILYRMQRNYKLSLDSLRDALQLDPQNEETKRLLSEVRAERRRAIKQQYSHYNSQRNW
ncbi:tetratricopeptide repeat protein [Cohnella suwonensis]|uniref:Tetratricopeptide repeat protein n=1 Tax=Cohnella suwonensis TaxID=696072 RepID=A0ABW0LR32_9BACL